MTVLDFFLPRWSNNKYRGLAVNRTTPPIDSPSVLSGCGYAHAGTGACVQPREREEGVKTHIYAVLKGCWDGILLDRPLPFKLHQSYRPLPCFIPALQEIWSGPTKNSAVMMVMTSTPRSASHYRGEVVKQLSSQPYKHVILRWCTASRVVTVSKFFLRLIDLMSHRL